jgi:hypothetical protein
MALRLGRLPFLRCRAVPGVEDAFLRSLETILGAAELPDDSDRVWSEIETVCLNAMPHWQAKLAGDTNEFAGFYSAMAARLRATIQRCARALSRTWALGPLGEPGKRFTGVLQPYLFLTDAELAAPTKGS